MRVIKNGNVYQLTSLARFFPVNCYLVEESEELTLIDAALGFSAKGILEAARTIGKPITNIVLTHAHDDHVGALDIIKKEFPKACVSISRRDAVLMAGDRSLEPGEPSHAIKGGVSTKVKTRPDRLLNEGDRIGSLEAVSSPGHTPGSMSFFDSRTRHLIAGDAFQTRGGLAVAGDMRPLFPFPAFGTWNKELSLKSAKKLMDLNPGMLACGHGELLFEPAQAMGEAITRLQNKIN